MSAKNEIKMIIKTPLLIFVLSMFLITGPLYGQGFPKPESVCAGCGAAIEKGGTLIFSQPVDSKIPPLRYKTGSTTGGKVLFAFPASE